MFMQAMIGCAGHIRGDSSSSSSTLSRSAEENTAREALKLEKYLQLQNGRRERGHAWERGIAHSPPGHSGFTVQHRRVTFSLVFFGFTPSFLHTHYISPSSAVTFCLLLLYRSMPQLVEELCQHVSN